MTNVALFGAGFIGRVHGANVAAHPRATLRYVCDIDTSAAAQLADRTGAMAIDDPAVVWADDAVDAVLIASSTDTHADLLRGALRAGKAVYCEKPIALDITTVMAVADEARDSDLPVFIGFCRRFDANHRAVRDAVAAGRIGDVEVLHLIARGPEPPPLSYIKVSGGQFRDQTIHFFDLACWLTDMEPTEVYATGAALADPAIGEAGDIDTSMLILTMSNGALCHIDNTRRAAYGYDERIEVFGAKAMVQSQAVRTRDVAFFTGDVVITDGLHPGWFERIEPTFALAFDAFVEVVEGRRTAYPSLADGVRAQLIAEAAVASLHAHRPVDVTRWPA